MWFKVEDNRSSTGQKFVVRCTSEIAGKSVVEERPAQGTAALQNALMDDLVAAGTKAIMISSVDPKTSIGCAPWASTGSSRTA